MKLKNAGSHSEGVKIKYAGTHPEGVVCRLISDPSNSLYSIDERASYGVNERASARSHLIGSKYSCT